MKFRIKHAQQVVGFFLLASVLALLVVLVFMGANQRWFARNYMFFTRFSSAEGITTGMSVRLRGFEIGKVSGIELNSFNRVRVDIAIYEDYYTKIRPDSVLELSVSPIGLGGGTMNLFPGLNQLPPMEENSFLPSSESTLGKALMAQGLVDKPQDNGAIAGIVAQIEPLLVEVRATATGVTRLLNNVNTAVEGKSQNHIATLLSEVQKTLATVEQVLSTTGTNTNTLLVSSQELLTNLNGISGNIDRLTSQMQDPKGLIPKLLDPQGSLKTFLDDKNALYNQVSQILSQVNDTLGEVKGLTAYLNRSTPQISGLLEDTKSTLKKTGDVMDGLKNNPLLKGGIPETKPQTSTPQGQREEDF
jgi:phospholipid/cholesterol/gamma-HCH transport system substrate-binding protein